MQIPRDEVERIEEPTAGETEGRLSDSNHTRLLFSPTGPPLAKGAGYFSDH